MKIAGASASLLGVLQRRMVERHGDLEEFSYDVFRTSQFTAGLQNQVSLFLYRVDVDQTRRHVDLQPDKPSHPQRYALGLELRYILTVWGQGAGAEREHEVLSELVEILDRDAIIAGDLLDPTFDWDDGDALKVSLESLTNEDMLRLWDAFDPPYQLSIPYLVRTMRLSPVERASMPPVDTRTNVYVPRVPTP